MLHADKQVKRDRGEEWRFNQPEFFPLFLIVSLPMQSRFQQVSKQRKRSLFSENRKKKRKETKMESDETNFPCSNSRPGFYGLFSQNTTSPELRAQLEFHCIAAGVYGNGTLTSWRGGNGWPNNRYATWERAYLIPCWYAVVPNCMYEY